MKLDSREIEAAMQQQKCSKFRKSLRTSLLAKIQLFKMLHATLLCSKYLTLRPKCNLLIQHAVYFYKLK